MMSISQQANTILNIQKAALHTLYGGTKLIKSIGQLQLIDKDGTLWLRINHWNSQEVLKSSQFYKIIYDNYITYIFQNIAGGFYAVSISKNDSNINTFEEKINATSKIMDFKTGLNDEEFKKKIQYHYPNVENNSVHNDDLFTPIFNIGGKIQNVVGQAIHPSLSNESFRTKTKNLFKRGWQNVKAGFRKVDQKTNLIPGVKAAKDFVGNTASKIKQTTVHAVEKVTNNNNEGIAPKANESL